MMPGRQIILPCLLCLTPAANAEVYTWTDEQGTRHFSDTAPAAVEPEPASFSPVSVIPMVGNIRQGEKVSAIHQQIQQSLERDRPAGRAGNRGEKSAARKKCDKLQQRLEKIQQRLRAGYSNDQGNSLRRQRRQLSQRYSRECILG